MALDMREIIVQSLFNVMKQKPLKKVTVSDVINQCGIARQTFYNYFDDINHLICWIFERDSDEMIGHYHLSSDWVDYLENVFRMFLRYKDFYTQAAKLDRQNSFSSFLLEYTRNDYMTTFETLLGKDAITDELRYAIGFNAYGAVNMALEYIKSGMKEDPKIMAHRTFSNMPQILRAYFPRQIED